MSNVKITTIDNGYLVIYEEDGEEIESVVVEDCGDQVDSFVNLLRSVDRLIGPSTSKYSEKRISIGVEPGESYESNIEKPMFVDSIDSLDYVPEGAQKKTDGLECFIDPEAVLGKAKDAEYLEVEIFPKASLLNPDELEVSGLIAIPKLSAAIIYKNFTEWRKQKAERAVKLMLIAANSEEFKKRVLDFNIKGRYGFASTNLSNQQVYTKLMEGSETLSPGSNYVMNLEICTYYSLKGVIGYTYPNTNQIFVNTRYFDTFYLSSIAGNFFHEWTHKLGFDHDFNSTSRRPYSVPYACGSIIVDIVSRM